MVSITKFDLYSYIDKTIEILFRYNIIPGPSQNSFFVICSFGTIACVGTVWIFAVDCCNPGFLKKIYGGFSFNNAFESIEQLTKKKKKEEKPIYFYC